MYRGCTAQQTIYSAFMNSQKQPSRDAIFVSVKPHGGAYSWIISGPTRFASGLGVATSGRASTQVIAETEGNKCLRQIEAKLKG